MRRGCRSHTRVAVAMSTAAALLVTTALAVTTAGPASAADPVTVVSTDFEDDTWTDSWAPSGDVTLTVVDDGGDRVLQVEDRGTDFAGIETAAGLLAALAPGDTASLTAELRLADGTPPTQARFVVKPAFTWVGNTDVTTDWTTLTGNYTVPTDAEPDQLSVYFGTADITDVPTYTYLLDDITITTTPADTCEPDDGCDYPADDVVVATDFEGGTLDGWIPRDNGTGAFTVDVTEGCRDSSFAAIVTDRTHQGQGIGYDMTCLLEPGVTHEFSGALKFADGSEVGDIWLTLAATTGGTTTFSTLGQLSGMSSSNWVDVAQRFQAASADSLLLYLETAYAGGEAGNTSTFLADDLVVRRLPPPEIQDLTPLKDTVSFRMGVAIDERETGGAASELLLRHFDQITAENHMKVEAWYDGQTFRTHPQAIALMDFAQQHGLAVYGHVLLWHSQTPDWFFQDDDGEWLTDDPADQQFMRDRLRAHIFAIAADLAARYGPFGSDTNPLNAWDVVNEVVSDSATDDGLRRSRWYDILGGEYIRLAFEYADEAFNDVYAADGSDRPVMLFINDYNTEQSGKQDRYRALVEQLLAEGVPIDGVGHQFHVSLSMPVSALEAAIVRFEDLDVVQAVTELDVVVGSANPARLIDQGYYYRDAFRVFRDHADQLAAVTVWGLTDGRSWRAGNNGQPLLFDDDLQAKPAYFGAADGELPDLVRSAIVFAADLDPGVDGPESVEWRKLPLHPIGETAGFQLRWAPDHLTLYVEVDDATADPEDGIEVDYDGGTVAFSRSGTGDVDGVVQETDDGYALVVELPLATPVTIGDVLELDVRVTDGSDTSGWNTPGRFGSLSLVEDLSYVEVVEASTIPLIDGDVDGVWSDPNAVTTSKRIEGTDGARADVRTLWSGNTLYVLAEVTDPEVDVSASDPWVQDSVEIYVDAGNAKNGAYRYDDMQVRINADNVRSFGTGDEAFQSNRVESAAARTAGGYTVEAAISLLEYGGAGTFHGLDFQVNDATAGARTAIHNWADPTGAGYQSTARWGVGQLVGATPEPVDVAPTVTEHPASARAPLGSMVTLSAAATGTPEPTVQWQYRRRGSPHWRNVVGAVAPTLEVTASTATNGTAYRAVFSNSAGSATTRAAFVRVAHTAPKVVLHPTSVWKARVGSVVRFTAAATGYPTPHVSWQQLKPGAAGSATTHAATLTVDTRHPPKPWWPFGFHWSMFWKGRHHWR